MERYKILIFLVLMLLPVCFAADNETIIQPTAPQTISIEKLISSMDAMKERIAALEVNNNELRVQLDAKLSSQYWGYLLFTAAWTIFILALRGILSEVWTWWMFSRKKRKVEKFQERIAAELRNTDVELRNITSMLQIINSSLVAIKSDVVAVEKQKKPEVKRSFWDKLLGRNKDAI
jgi:hypothetical protein